MSLGGLLPVAVLCASRSSHYFGLAREVYDAKRNALTYTGDLPVVAHPPCRAFGRLRGMAKPVEMDFELASHAVQAVQRCGGVLEHPAHSTLWKLNGLPHSDGSMDEWGGFTVPFLQSWFGHRAPKRTWLYIVGIRPRDLPQLPFELGEPLGRIENMGEAERERTPPELALYLVNLAHQCRRSS